MTSVPHVRSLFHTPTEPFAGRRWSSRAYPGDLAQTSWVRADLAADLHRLAGMPTETSENMVLCVSEMFANSVDHSLSGQDPDGRVIRTLYMPTATTIQVAIVDDGWRTDTTAPHGPGDPRAHPGGVGRGRARPRPAAHPPPRRPLGHPRGVGLPLLRRPRHGHLGRVLPSGAHPVNGPQLDPGVREVLTAPRGHRFSRPGQRPMPATREELFEQMMEHPKVRHRVEHGEVPPWMTVHAARLTAHATPEEPREPPPPRPPAPFVPRPRPAPDDGPPPPRPPRAPRPPLPRRPRSHRKPRRRLRWTLLGYTLATTAGALAHHLSTLFF